MQQAKFGIESQDQIIKINNKKIRLKSNIDEILQNSNGKELKITIKRENEKRIEKKNQNQVLIANQMQIERNEKNERKMVNDL